VRRYEQRVYEWLAMARPASCTTCFRSVVSFPYLMLDFPEIGIHSHELGGAS
jgi:hypothetical protein